MFATPFAVVVATNPSDLAGAVKLAATARAAGAVIETPLAHSPADRQIRRARGSGAARILVLDGDKVEMIRLSDDARTVSDVETISSSLPLFYGASEGSLATVVSHRFHRGIRGGALPRAA